MEEQDMGLPALASWQQRVDHMLHSQKRVPGVTEVPGVPEVTEVPDGANYSLQKRVTEVPDGANYEIRKNAKNNTIKHT